MLDTALKTQLKAYLEKLQRPIELVAAADEGPTSQEMLALLRDIAELSPKVTLVQRADAGERVPSFSIGAEGEPARIRFAGLPMGHEFTSLVLALLQSGGHPPKVDAALIDQIRSLEAAGGGALRFETYMSLSCQNCPDVVQALNLLAVLNPRVQHVAIDGALFQTEIEQRQIMAVPTVDLNGQVFGQGRMTAEDIVARLDSGAAQRDARRLNDKPVFDMLIVGGGPAGAAAAVYAARKGIRTGVVAERFGGQTLDTLGIENFISVKETEGPKFAAALEQHVRDYEVDVMTAQRAEKLVTGEVGDPIAVQLANGAVLKARSVIISTGARWREVNVPGEREYRNRGVA
jgi:alkyl hydroperoxide reductase subunit F